MTKDLNQKLKATVFGIIIDETNDVSTEKKLAVVVQYYNFEDKKLVVEVLDLIECPNGTAESISTTLIDLLKSVECHLNNCVGFSSDTCNVMFRAKNSVSVQLKKVIPNIAFIICA